MAAYAALVSLMYIIDQIKHHPRPPVSLDKTQVESLTEKVTFLQEFLENYSHIAGCSEEADALESRIADAAYAAEDIIECRIVDQIHAGYKSRRKKIEHTSHGKKISSVDLYRGLRKVIQNMDTIKKEVMEIKEMGVQDQLQRNSVSVVSLGSSTGQNITMVGFDDVSLKLMDKLTGGRLDCQIVPIVGMGGIGKTTLARNIYQNQVVAQHFDIRIWVTISQKYKMRELLLELLQEGGGIFSQMSEYKLGINLHKKLSRRRYLITIDDIWDIEVWEELKLFFPDNNNGSRIMLTTRLSYLATGVADSGGIQMGFLDEDNSWNLFSEIVFGEKGCPHDLEKIGKEVVKNCRGLPLSIVVIGGLLAKSKHGREYWEYIGENLNSIVNSEDNESCLKILRMSYSQLPVHLKPCFLYMGIFSEETVIRVSMLIKLWVSEGFLKPICGKSLEEVAIGYLKELIDRNLVLVHELGSTGNIKYCNIHDLLRDLCLREAQKERFYNVIRQHCLDVPQDRNTQRRIVIPESTSRKKVLDALQSASAARSLMRSVKDILQMPANFSLLRILRTKKESHLDALQSASVVRSLLCSIKDILPTPANFPLMRILRTKKESDFGASYFLENVFQLVNSRYLAIGVHMHSQFPSSVCLLWNLHTLITDSDFKKSPIAPVEIWNMPLLRHVKFGAGLYLPDPPNGNISRRDDILLGNLQTLKRIKNFRCGEEVVKRIPNIKKLEASYTSKPGGGLLPDYCLNNLGRLHKLESFYCRSFLIPSETDILKKLTFPHSLKKLTIGDSHVDWEDMLEKIGSLPLLEKLRLYRGSFKERKWETVDGQFCSLKFLLIEGSSLEYWMTESSHFPRLEHLVLRELYHLKEIPSEIGEIPTLKSIELRYCRNSAVFSAKKILEEQEVLQGEVDLQVRVKIYCRNEELERLASPNFQFERWLDLHMQKNKNENIGLSYQKDDIKLPPPTP